MNQFDQQWQKLTALARRAADARDCAAPYGFAVRVAAQAVNLPAFSPWALPERFAFRGLMVAAAFGLGAMAFGFSTIMPEPADDYAITDTVAEILDLT